MINRFIKEATAMKEIIVVARSLVDAVFTAKADKILKRSKKSVFRAELQALRHAINDSSLLGKEKRQINAFSDFELYDFARKLTLAMLEKEIKPPAA